MTPQNLMYHVKDIAKLNQMISQKSPCMKPANIVSLIRLYLLEENGGIWMDISILLTEDLGWLENLAQ